jgi:peptide/nickel transport system ATP-binding protein
MMQRIKKIDHQEVILGIEDLAISYETRDGDVQAVRDVSFKVHRAETVGLVGESGCGKSSIAFGIVDFLGRNGKVVSGNIHFKAQNLIGRSRKTLRKLRGNQIAMVYQDPMQALNPSLRIGLQLTETLIHHQEIAEKEARKKSIEMLTRVHMPDAQDMMDRFPHQLSGGQQQRVVIAMALLNNPALLIMDEPTTALDVTVEASVLDLIDELKQDFNTGIIYITHNLGVIARVSDSVSVMYAGEIIERGGVIEIFNNPRHPYTKGLLECVPRLGYSKDSTQLHHIRGRVPAPPERPEDACIYAPRCDYATEKCRSAKPALREITVGHFGRCFNAEVIDSHGWHTRQEALSSLAISVPSKDGNYSFLKIKDLKTYYKQESRTVLGLLGLEKKRYVKAVDKVSLDAKSQRTFGIVGESGCGKSTLVKTIIGLENSTDGSAEFMGFDLTAPLRNRELKLIKNIQMVFQNPDSTLNPSYSVGRQIGRKLKRFKIVPKDQIRSRVRELLKAVRLDNYYYHRLPRQLSGGEKQRVGIARALATQPKMVLCDEPVSALDVSVQASVLNLLMDVQKNFGATILFIAHDLSVVRFISDYIAVMYLGQIVEVGPAEFIYSPPYHPYTEALLSAVPIPDPTVEQKKIRLIGSVPSALNPPSGCRFHTRCPRRSMLPSGGRICEVEVPQWRIADYGHSIFCHISLKELAKIEAVIGRKDVSK